MAAIGRRYWHHDDGRGAEGEEGWQGRCAERGRWAEGSERGWTGVEGGVEFIGGGQSDVTPSKRVAQSSVREGAMIASGTGVSHTALDVCLLTDGGIRTEAAKYLAIIGEAVVPATDVNGHRWDTGGAIIAGSTLAHATC